MHRVQGEIHEALRHAGRVSDTVRLIAVSKYTQPNDGLIDMLLEAGCHDLGEARPQMLLEKAEVFSAQREKIRWHLIGQLQRNKVRKVLPWVSLIHSVDSVRLLDAINRIAQEDQLSPVRVLLEINISRDETKQGFSPSDFPAVFEEIATLPLVQIKGLMCMSGLDSDESTSRREFAAVRELAEKMKPVVPENCRLQELSMGMSDDFKLAIHEGATMVRVGSTLFEGVLW